MPHSIPRRSMLARTALAGAAVAGAGLAGTAAARASSGNPQPSGLTPTRAQEALLDLFRRYQVVGGMSPDHTLKDADDSSV